MEKTSGFTLVELLVVIAIIGVLMGVVVAVLNPATFFERGRDSRRLSDLATIQTALEQYYAQQGEYPSVGYLIFGSIFVDPDDATLIYLKSVPNDPSGAPAAYDYCTDGTPPSDYEVCADMEDDANLPDDCITTSSYGCSGNCCLTNPF